MKSPGARLILNGVMTAVCGAAVIAAVFPLVSLLWLVVSRGAHGLSWAFFTHAPAPVGETGGGMGNAIAGSFFIVGLATLGALPVGVGAGVFLAERRGSRIASAIGLVADVLSGVPSIVIGIVAYGLVVIPMHGFSALAGAVALGLLMVPTLARTTEELVGLVPRSLREAALALGLSEWRASLRVVIRTAAGGIATAALLAIARAMGETAPLLFTSLNNQYWSARPTEPTASMTVQIFNYAISPYEDWHQQAWTGALVILLLVGALNLVARFVTRPRFAARS